MKRVLITIFAASFALTAAAQSSIVQAHLEPSHRILVGQPVRMVVTVYVPNYFTGSPDFPEFEIENAIVVLPQDRPANSNTQIGGVRYAGITETYVIYPQQAGDFHLPREEVTVPYALAPPKSTNAHVPLPALAFHADVPAAARDLDYFLPTAALTMQQKWSSPMTNLRVGDTIERTVTITATKMQSMLIPPLPLDAPHGIRVYPEEPIVHDQKTDRGDFVYGRRIQTAKYVIQKEGDYTLPPIELKWWNLSSHRLVTATLPAVHFLAAANTNYVTELPPESEQAPDTPAKHRNLWEQYRLRILITSLCCIAAALLLSMIWYWLPRARRRLQTWQERWRHSEATYFHNLQRACTQNNAAESYVWLLKWIALAYPGVSLQQALKPADNPALTSNTNDLGESLFGQRNQDHSWNGRRFAALLRQQRKHHRMHLSKHQYLNDLNPK
jgi:hypothetical protein